MKSLHLVNFTNRYRPYFNASLYDATLAGITINFLAETDDGEHIGVELTTFLRDGDGPDCVKVYIGNETVEDMGIDDYISDQRGPEGIVLDCLEAYLERARAATEKAELERHLNAMDANVESKTITTI